MKIYSILGTSTEIIDNMDNPIYQYNYVEMIDRRPSSNYISQIDGTWIEDNSGTQYNLTEIIQNHLDTSVQKYGHTSILSLCSQVLDKNTKLQTEGQVGIEFFDKTWKKAYEILKEVKDGARGFPTKNELISLLPVLVWPDIII